MAKQLLYLEVATTRWTDYTPLPIFYTIQKSGTFSPFLLIAAVMPVIKMWCLIVHPRNKASIYHPTYEGGINSVTVTVVQGRF